MKFIPIAAAILGTAMLGAALYERYVSGNVQNDFMPAVGVLAFAIALKVLMPRETSRG